MRLIDADELKKVIFSKSDNMEDLWDTAGVLNAINNAPTVEQPTGHWINHYDDLFPAESTEECSICHQEQSIGNDDNYCPNCGAKMKGAKK